MKVSLALLAFIHLWSSDTLSTHVGEHEIMQHGSRPYTECLLDLQPSSELGVWHLPLSLDLTDKFGLLVPSGPHGAPGRSLYWSSDSCLFPIPEVLGPAGSPKALSLLIHAGIMGHLSENMVLLGHFCWTIPVQLKRSDHSWVLGFHLKLPDFLTCGFLRYRLSHVWSLEGCGNSEKAASAKSRLRINGCLQPSAELLSQTSLHLGWLA